SKLMFLLGNLTGDAAKWAYPFNHQLLHKNDPGVTAPTLEQFSASFSRYFLDPERKSKAERALQTIRQTSSVMAYTQQFNLQVYKSGEHSVLSGCTFSKLPDIQTLAIQLTNEIEASQSHPAHPTHNPNPPSAADPKSMDLSAMNSQLSDTNRNVFAVARRVTFQGISPKEPANPPDQCDFQTLMR
ncbi:hypothetical protein VP01_9817g1, partial [Puccinia sorghi]